MRVQFIGNYYSNPVNNLNKSVKKGNNISFSSSISKYKRALDLYECREKIAKCERNLEYAQKYGSRSDIENAKEELRTSKLLIDFYESQYASCDPTGRDYYENVEKGRIEQEKVMEECRQRAKSRPQTSDSDSYSGPDSTTIWDITGTSDGDWPFYVP